MEYSILVKLSIAEYFVGISVNAEFFIFSACHNVNKCRSTFLVTTLWLNVKDLDVYDSYDLE